MTGETEQDYFSAAKANKRREKSFIDSGEIKLTTDLLFFWLLNISESMNEGYFYLRLCESTSSRNHLSKHIFFVARYFLIEPQKRKKKNFCAYAKKVLKIVDSNRRSQQMSAEENWEDSRTTEKIAMKSALACGGKEIGGGRSREKFRNLSENYIKEFFELYDELRGKL